MRTLLLRGLVCASFAISASAQDLAISKIGGGNDYRYYGTSSGIAAYSIATTSCNVGNVTVLWNDSIDQAPAIATNMYRVDDGRITMLGYSWLKDGFCAVNENSCGTCQVTSCNTLGVGCADTYSAGLNDGASGVSKYQLNPVTGAWPSGSWDGPSGALPLRGRLQVPASEIQDPDSVYVSESIYISEDDQMAGNGRNNVSWQEFRFNSIDQIQNLGTIQMFDPAIYAWKDRYPDVHIDEVINTNEGGLNVHGYFFVGSKATSLGNGQWRYDYAVMNMNSAQAGGSLELEFDGAVSDVFFRDVDHHSGSVWANTDWTFNQSGSTLRWEAPTTHGQDPNGNALRWGTLYNFGFTTSAAPEAALGQATLGLYAPGVASSRAASVILPESNANQAPVVSAGPDRNAGTGIPIALDGTATDDGLPGGPLAYSWERVSGPGGINFSFNFREDTDATFYVPGTYVVRFTVDDGELTTSDELTVTVSAASVPPTVSAGPDLSAMPDQAILLDGTVTHPTPWTVGILWTQVSGPGGVNFGTNQRADTNATFYVPGVYVLRLTATESGLPVSDDVVVNVSNVQPPVVNAGPDLTANVNTAVTLNGAFTFGTPWTVSVLWEKVSGPGGVNFGFQQRPITPATFYVPGTYVLRMTASDGPLIGSDEVTVIVN